MVGIFENYFKKDMTLSFLKKMVLNYMYLYVHYQVQLNIPKKLPLLENNFAHGAFSYYTF